MNIVNQHLQVTNSLFKMVLTFLILIFIILLITGKANAGTTGDFSIDDEIIEADLIIKGKLINTFSRLEDISSNMRNGDNEILTHIPSSIYTTYIFNIEEVLKGEFDNENIKVLMLGGCDYELDLCVDYSFNYYYEVGEEAVLFLTKRTNATNAYKADQGSDSAYAIKNNILIRKSVGGGEDEVNNEDDGKYLNKLSFGKDKKVKIKNTLTLQGLRTKVLEWRDKNEK